MGNLSSETVARGELSVCKVPRLEVQTSFPYHAELSIAFLFVGTFEM